MTAQACTSISTLADHDWSRTAIGEPDNWPHTLRLTVDIILNAPLPMVVMWGREQVMLFNDAYAALAGMPHQQAPGGKVPAMQPSAWSWNALAIEQAWDGAAQVFAGAALHLWRQGGISEHHFDLYYTPLRDADGAVQGILCTLAPPTGLGTVASSGALRILVVEDNLDAQYLVCEMLRAFGHEVEAEASGEAALEHLRRRGFDVLFSDVSLPGISGVELARRAVAELPALQVIFASGYGTGLTQQLEFAAEAIQKPYEIEQLQAILDRVAAKVAGRR
ncbi:response regulator [Pseudoduganella buxea]|uniref:Response regulator n=1 Tax=Pseudoduganella buxea TaxID=1949069 RepID=A0A6I3T9M6_9BURK|nr:response regulator [Pseudoduganella buxea]MTV56377.1 response regulator [Pseudoduganella buxea]GGC13637.1 hypothetical protein GCM10011572_38770 [Pseudoduganella buxea]